MRVFPRFLLGVAILPLLTVAARAQAPAPGAATTGAARDTTTWTTYKGDPQRTGSSDANVRLPLSLLWRFSASAPARSYDASPLVLGAPGDQNVFFAVGRNIYCLSTQTGQQVWRSNNFTSNPTAPLTVLGTDTGDVIISAQQSGKVSALRVADGALAWEGDAQGSLSNAAPVVISTVNGPRIVCALSTGRLVAFAPDGTLDPNWRVTLSRFGAAPTTSMTLSSNGSLIFLATSDAKVYAVDARRGAVAYSVPLGGTSLVTPTIAGDQLIVCSPTRVQGLQASGGAAQWSFDPRGEVVGSPAVGRDVSGKRVVFFGTRGGSFFALDDSGGQVWKTDLGVRLSGSPLVLPSMVVVGTGNGLLIALDPSNGTVLWQYRLKSERVVQSQPADPNDPNAQPTSETRLYGVSSAPAAVDGQLYVLADNAALYGFSTQRLDAVPPRLIEPSLAVPNENGRVTALLLAPDNAVVVPGRGPIYFAGQLDDTGSGIDPASFSVSLDGTALPATAINFDAASGVLTLTLLDPQQGGTSFPDGPKTLNLTARDYAGNALQSSLGFLVDNTAAPPAAQPNDGGDQNPPPGAP